MSNGRLQHSTGSIQNAPFSSLKANLLLDYFFLGKTGKVLEAKTRRLLFLFTQRKKRENQKKKSTASGDLEANRTAVHRRRHRLLSTALFGAHKQQSESKPPLNINLNCNPSVCRYTTTTKHREPSSSTAYESQCLNTDIIHFRQTSLVRTQHNNNNNNSVIKKSGDIGCNHACVKTPSKSVTIIR